jgi:hypothetical protein
VSYDLHVFAQQPLDAQDLRRLLAEAGLSAEEASGATPSLTVVRGARARYTFTLGLPVGVEAEDVPEEVTAVLLEPSYLYELMVEGSSATEKPHAVRFARRLAQASAGVVLDPQTEQVWARGKLRAMPPVQRGTIALVDVTWYVPPDGTGAAAARAWLDLARRHLPEALPRRFGPYEPLSMKLDVDGPDAFVESVATETMFLSYKASAPCIDGNLAGGAGRPGVHSHQLSVHRDALEDPRWRAALQRLFVDFAVATEAVFASAEVRRGVGWSGRSTWFGHAAERTTHLAARGRWAGLLPYPPWWSWFGPDYVPLVLDHLPAQQVLFAGGGVFHARGEEPLDQDQLTAALIGSSVPSGPRRILRDLFGRRDARASAPAWLPPELLPVVDESDPRVPNPPLTRATTMPAGLREDH